MAHEVDEVSHTVDDDAVEFLNSVITAAIHLPRVGSCHAVVDVAG